MAFKKFISASSSMLSFFLLRRASAEGIFQLAVLQLRSCLLYFWCTLRSDLERDLIQRLPFYRVGTICWVE